MCLHTCTFWLSSHASRKWGLHIPPSSVPSTFLKLRVDVVLLLTTGTLPYSRLFIPHNWIPLDQDETYIRQHNRKNDQRCSPQGFVALLLALVSQPPAHRRQGELWSVSGHSSRVCYS